MSRVKTPSKYAGVGKNREGMLYFHAAMRRTTGIGEPKDSASATRTSVRVKTGSVLS